MKVHRLFIKTFAYTQTFDCCVQRELLDTAGWLFNFVFILIFFFSFFFFQSHRISLNYLLVNLAVADILYAVFIAPKVLVKLTVSHPDGLTGIFLCKLVTGGNLAWVGSASSIVTLVAISVERYYSVMYLFNKRGKLTRRRLKVCEQCS